jgi:FtsZ-interacting cell division protein ZipA
MPELRWTLLILGALFIGGLALWELRRQRLARGTASAPGATAGGSAREGERLSPRFDEAASDVSFGDSVYTPARGVFREPTLNLPDMPNEVSSDGRERFADPPVVELDDASLAGLKVEAQAAIDEFSSVESEAAEPRPVEPMIPRLSAAVAAPTLAPAEAEAIGAEADAPDADAQVSEARTANEHDEATARFDVAESAATPAFVPVVPDAVEVVEPVVEWPDEDSRKIVALRLVSGIGERFPGRAVRLALAAEGFVFGKFQIFHKPGPDARAVLSAASLTKPGTFSPGTMDGQRFGGISLFAVLPGPLTPLATFDELLTTARALNDRLRGALQDERGEPLTPMRSASIRESLSASATAMAPVVTAAAPPPVVGSPGSASPA